MGDPVDVTLLASLQRMGRSELAVPIISTQLVTDALVGERASLENLLGATFAFGMRSRRRPPCFGAARVWTLKTAALRARTCWTSSQGRCLFRDHRGRVEAIQVEVVVPALLRAFSTTPRVGAI